MLPSLVIGLREGLEAALIVGIVAAFLRANGRLDLLKWVWTGVLAGVLLCLAVGVGLSVASANLPARQQEGLETVIALVAVGFVTYMVAWMRVHARGLRAKLESAAGSALTTGSSWALVAMAFLAVVREGFETAVFLVAAFNEADDPRAAGTGVVLGIVGACLLGAAIYRGGLRIDLARFFRVTGIVLVVVAAGLVVAALHSAHEAGWIDVGQRQLLDLTWLVDPGSIRSSLITGILGLPPRPVVVEVGGWLVYLVPVLAFVLWPAGRTVSRRAVLLGTGATAVAAAVAAAALAVAEPARPDTSTAALATAAGQLDVTVVDRDGDAARFRFAGDAVGEPFELAAAAASTDQRGGRDATVFATAAVDFDPAGDQLTVPLTEVAELNGGRLPLGVTAETDPGDVPVSTSLRRSATVWLDDATGVVLDAELATSQRTVAVLSVGEVPLGTSDEAVLATAGGASAAQGRTAVYDASRLDLVDEFEAWELVAIAVAILAAVAVVVTWVAIRTDASGQAPPPPRAPPAGADPVATAIPS
jgi:high-affinity iron transporter